MAKRRTHRHPQGFIPVCCEDSCSKLEFRYAFPSGGTLYGSSGSGFVELSRRYPNPGADNGLPAATKISTSFTQITKTLPTEAFVPMLKTCSARRLRACGEVAPKILTNAPFLAANLQGVVGFGVWALSPTSRSHGSRTAILAPRPSAAIPIFISFNPLPPSSALSGGSSLARGSITIEVVD